MEQRIIKPTKFLVYTRWVRVTWDAPLLKIRPNRYWHDQRRLQFHIGKLEVVIMPVKKSEWKHNGPQHIFGWEFDK